MARDEESTPRQPRRLLPLLPLGSQISVALGATLISPAVEIAAQLAGQRLTADRSTWLADLVGSPEEGRPLTGRAQCRYAAGLFWAAIRMRLHDLAILAWRPMDWLLRSDERVFVATLAVAAVMVRDFYAGGGHSNLFSNWDNLFALGGSTWAATVALRRYRGITPKPPKSRRQRTGADR